MSRAGQRIEKIPVIVEHLICDRCGRTQGVTVLDTRTLPATAVDGVSLYAWRTTPEPGWWVVLRKQDFPPEKRGAFDYCPTCAPSIPELAWHFVKGPKPEEVKVS